MPLAIVSPTVRLASPEDQLLSVHPRVLYSTLYRKMPTLTQLDEFVIYENGNLSEIATYQFLAHAALTTAIIARS